MGDSEGRIALGTTPVTADAGCFCKLLVGALVVMGHQSPPRADWQEHRNCCVCGVLSWKCCVFHE